MSSAAAAAAIPAVVVAAGLQQLLVEFGRLLARMHDGGVVHGALSSSCALVTHTDQALVSSCSSNSSRNTTTHLDEVCTAPHQGNTMR